MLTVHRTGISHSIILVCCADAPPGIEGLAMGAYTGEVLWQRLGRAGYRQDSLESSSDWLCSMAEHTERTMSISYYNDLTICIFPN